MENENPKLSNDSNKFLSKTCNTSESHPIVAVNVFREKTILTTAWKVTVLVSKVNQMMKGYSLLCFGGGPSLPFVLLNKQYIKILMIVKWSTPAIEFVTLGYIWIYWYKRGIFRKQKQVKECVFVGRLFRKGMELFFIFILPIRSSSDWQKELLFDAICSIWTDGQLPIYNFSDIFLETASFGTHPY